MPKPFIADVSGETWGSRHARRRHGIPSPANVEALLVAAGFANGRELAKAADVTTWFLNKLFASAVPANHPFLPRLASVLRIPLETLQTVAGCQAVPPMEDKQVRRIESRWGADVVPRGRRLVPVPRRGVEAPVKRSYNKLRKLDDDARQVARSLVMTTNVAMMAGKRYVTLENVPTAALGRVLTRYLALEGAPDGAVVTADFSEIFG